MKPNADVRGFTLMEILICLVILGILAAIVAPQFSRATPANDDNSLASATDSPQDRERSDNPWPDSAVANAANPTEAAPISAANGAPSANSSLQTHARTNNPLNPIESASARADDSN